MTTLPHPVVRLSSAAQAIYGAALVFMAGASLIVGPQIAAERLPMQWGLDGAPTWLAPKALSLWGLVASAAVGGAILLFTARRSEQISAALWWLLIVFSLFMAFVQAFHLVALLRWTDV